MLSDWYLEILIEEAIRELSFERYTLMRFEEQMKMEKGDQIHKSDKTPSTATPIIIAPSKKHKEVYNEKSNYFIN